MAIDYVVHFECVPKQTLSTEGILARLKGRARAQAVVDLFRSEGDQRPVNEIGFELARGTPDGNEEIRTVMVQDLLDEAAQLEPLAHHCVGCPANANAEPFGCYGFIQYPISSKAEGWLLNQLPSQDEPLIWLLLRNGLQELNYDGQQVTPLRTNGAYFEEKKVRGRELGSLIITANQVFEMLFLLGNIQPAHAGILLLFFNAIPRSIEAGQIVGIMNDALTPDEIREQYPFRQTPVPDDDQTIRELKAYFHALYVAWTLKAKVLLDV